MPKRSGFSFPLLAAVEEAKTLQNRPFLIEIHMVKEAGTYVHEFLKETARRRVCSDALHQFGGYLPAFFADGVFAGLVLN